MSLRIGHREIVAIVGANGAGKSTLLKAIAGVAPLASGRIRFVGEDIGRVAPEERVRLGIGLAPEGRQLFGSLSVRDNLAVGRYARVRAAGLRHLVRPSGAEGRDLEAAMAEVFGFFPRLAERAGQPAGTLTGGEAADARDRPRADEPAAAADARRALARARAADRQGDPRGAAALTARGISVLLVEQNAAQALRSPTAPTCW